MANSVSNVSVGKPKIGGAIHYAPVGTPLPTSVTAELNPAFMAMGYVSEDGVVNSSNIESEKIKAWGGDTVLAIQTGREDTFTYTLLEVLNPNVLKAVHNANNVTGTLNSGITINVNGQEQELASWVIDVIMTNNVLKRIVIPKGQVSSIGDVTYKEDTPIGYEITLTCLPDDNENTHYEYIMQGKSIRLNASNVSVDVGKTVTLTATTTPAGGTVTWESSDTSKATVSGGVITGVAAGSATITATYEGNSATCAVTVTEAVDPG